MAMNHGQKQIHALISLVNGIKWFVTLSLLLFVIASAGLFAAGSLRFFEILVEVIVVTAFLFSPDVALPQPVERELKSRNLMLDLIYARFHKKRASLQDVLLGGDPGAAILKVIFVGIAFGWFLTLGWFFVKDWTFVVARELIETGLDLWIFIPAFFLLRAHFQNVFAGIEAARKKEVVQIARQRTHEDELLQMEEDEEEYEPTSSVFSMSPSLAERQAAIHVSYMILPDASGYDIDDIRESQDWDRDRRWERTRQRRFMMRIALMGIFGLIPFGVGVMISDFWPLDLTSELAEWIFSSLLAPEDAAAD